MHTFLATSAFASAAKKRAAGETLLEVLDTAATRRVASAPTLPRAALSRASAIWNIALQTVGVGHAGASMTENLTHKSLLILLSGDGIKETAPIPD